MWGLPTTCILNSVKNNSFFPLLQGGLASLLVCLFATLYVLLSPSACLAQAAGAPTAAESPVQSKLALVPMPREIHERGVLPLAQGISVSILGHDADDKFAATELVRMLKDRGVDAREEDKGKVKVILLRLDTKKAAGILAHEHVSFDAGMHDEGYILVTDGNTTYDIAATGAGLYYGTQTIQQLIVADRSGPHPEASLHGVLIRDWPAMKYRGVSDDLSRGPVPTLAFQKHQVRVFSEYKMNIYSPYFENTLAYASNPLAAPPGGAMTRADVEQLVRYAQQYHVTIVPEQEAFGHLHHALMFDTYSKLAETPEGSVLAPGQPGSVQLIQQWFTEIASMFPGPFIHIGADETFDLGKGQTKTLADKEGLGKVYIDFLTQIYKSLQPLHKRILFWGDIAMNDPGLVKTLPKDMIAVAWEYNPQPQGFDKWLRPFVDAGLETWVAPSVNSWSRVYPDSTAGLPNIQGFVSDGQRLGSTGELNTLWYDDGEGLFNQNWYGVLFGAAAGWQSGLSSIPQFQNNYGQVFHGDLTGKINQAQIELMAAQSTLVNAGLGGARSGLFWADPLSPSGQALSAKLLPVAHTLRVHAEKAIILIDEARAAGPLREADAVDAMEVGARRIDFIGYNFEAAQLLVDEYHRAYLEQADPSGSENVSRELSNISGINGQCQDLRDGYGLIRDLYRQAYLQENRPYWLDNLTAQYDLAMQLWISRGRRFSEIRDQWNKTGKLPAPQEVGLPPVSATATGDAGKASSPGQ